MNFRESEVGNEVIIREATQIEADVSITAKQFFERKGFEVVQQQTVVRQGVELTNFKMKKSLT